MSPSVSAEAVLHEERQVGLPGRNAGRVLRGEAGIAQRVLRKARQFAAQGVCRINPFDRGVQQAQPAGDPCPRGFARQMSRLRRQ